MQLRETADQRALRHELRAYFAEAFPEAERRGMGEEGVGGSSFRDVVKRLGNDGWLGIGWPTEYGGQGRGEGDQFIFFDEINRAGVPFPFVTVNTVGPTLMQYGTDEQRQRFLPGILSGDVVFAIGYTEPGAGTDLASLTTRAVPDGDSWLVNGTKVFTSGANTADYVWLAVRTDTEAPKHKGISLVICDTNDPGFSWTPIHTVGGMMVTTTYYDDVHIGPGDVVGEINDGWRLITSQLNHERIGLAALGGRAEQLWEDTLAWARSSGALQQPWVRQDLAMTHARLEAMRLLNWQTVEAVRTNTLSGAGAAVTKVYGTETHLDVYRVLRGVIGAAGRIRPGSPGQVLAGRVEQATRHGVVNTFGGGVNEVLRDMIASDGAGLPRGRR